MVDRGYIILNLENNTIFPGQNINIPKPLSQRWEIFHEYAEYFGGHIFNITGECLSKISMNSEMSLKYRQASINIVYSYYKWCGISYNRYVSFKIKSIITSTFFGKVKMKHKKVYFYI